MRAGEEAKYSEFNCIQYLKGFSPAPLWIPMQVMQLAGKMGEGVCGCLSLPQEQPLTDLMSMSSTVAGRKLVTKKKKEKRKKRTCL